MPIKQLINEPFEIILLSREDEVLKKNSHEQITKYQMTRNLDALDLTDVSEAPTKLTVMPLLPDYEYLLSVAIASNLGAMRELVRHHIIASDEPTMMFERDSKGRMVLTEDSCNAFLTQEDVVEILTVVKEGVTRGNTVPFSLLDTWRQRKRELAIAELLV
jgi:hypothetical protein